MSEALSEMPHHFRDNDCTRDHTVDRTIVLHNVQSLRKHFDEMVHDSRILDADMICLTETWLTNFDDIEKFYIENFEFHQLTRYQAYDDVDDIYKKLKTSKGGGKAIYIKNTCNIIRKQLSVNNIEGILLEDPMNQVIYVVLYRPNVYTSQKFLMNLEMLLQELDNRTDDKVVMGDFNENLFASDVSVLKLMEQYGYHESVDFPTTENATLIDHVYSKLHRSKIQAKPMPIYYSYHEAISLNISLISY